MNLEELKAEAAKHGYTLTKKPERVRLEKCPCGGRATRWYVVPEGYVYECTKCDLRGDIGRTDVEARKAWNEAVAEAVSAE